MINERRLVLEKSVTSKFSNIGNVITWTVLTCWFGCQNADLYTKQHSYLLMGKWEWECISLGSLFRQGWGGDFTGCVRTAWYKVLDGIWIKTKVDLISFMY